jgi:hypothetical protein
MGRAAVRILRPVTDELETSGDRVGDSCKIGSGSFTCCHLHRFASRQPRLRHPVPGFRVYRSRNSAADQHVPEGRSSLPPRQCLFGGRLP